MSPPRMKKGKQTVINQTVIRRPATAARRKRRRVGRLFKFGFGDKQSALLSYAAAMNDPFLHGPCRLGFDNFCSTKLATAYLRTSFSPNADGSFALTVLPWNNLSPFRKCLSGLAEVPTWTNGALSNYAAIIGLKSGRLTSGGFRVWVSYAATDKPGVLYVGGIPEPCPARTFVTGGAGVVTPQNLINYPNVQACPVSRGAAGMYRPIDNFAFEFSSYMTQQSAVASSLDCVDGWCVPFICGEGLPATATIFCEVALNYEGFISSDPNVEELTLGDRPMATAEKTLADYFSSPAQLVKAAKPYMNSGMILDAATMATELMGYPGAAAVLKGIGSARVARGGSLADLAKTAKAGGYIAEASNVRQQVPFSGGPGYSLHTEL